MRDVMFRIAKNNRAKRAQRHQGPRGEVFLSCPCPECMAAFSPDERESLKTYLERCTERSQVLAKYTAKRVAKRLEKPKTILRRRSQEG